MWKSCDSSFLKGFWMWDYHRLYSSPIKTLVFFYVKPFEIFTVINLYHLQKKIFMSHHLKTKIDQSYTPATKTWWDNSIHGRFVVCGLSLRGDWSTFVPWRGFGLGEAVGPGRQRSREIEGHPWNGNPETAKPRNGITSWLLWLQGQLGST